MSTARATSPRRWQRAAAGVAIALSAFTVTACGEDVVDDGVQQEVEEGAGEVEQEVEEGLDGEENGG